jgi:hypothetical protein
VGAFAPDTGESAFQLSTLTPDPVAATIVDAVTATLGLALRQ